MTNDNQSLRFCEFCDLQKVQSASGQGMCFANLWALVGVQVVSAGVE